MADQSVGNDLGARGNLESKPLIERYGGTVLLEYNQAQLA